MVIAKNKLVVGGSPFGRIPSLTAQIRELIHDYPEGIGIIKELAQNADDAGARLLDIFIDRRQHPTESLPAPDMAALQGPALLFFNDSVFTEDDFDRIQEIYRSGKIRAADKTGQFGKGFNTVYNVTDWPSFVTGERVAFFDPHCSLIPGANRMNPGRYWTLAECWDQYPDMLAPFSAAGLEAGSTHFEGTIFRLPFRTTEQAARSEISRKPFGEDSLRGLIEELTEVRESLLLFLKQIERIRLREVLPSGEECERIVVETANIEEVRKKRQELLSILNGDALAVVQRLRGRAPVLVSYEHHFRTACLDRDRDEVVNENSAWRVVHCLSIDAEGKIAEAIESMLGGDVKAVPFGGAAARLAPAPVENEFPTLRGKVYCSLPLPIDTSLPVHLNGFFDLDSSRHALTTETGLTGGAKVRARWNQLLVEHVVAPAYAHLIDHLAGDLGDDPSRYYAHWPRPDLSLLKPLDTLVRVVYQNLAPLEVIRVRGDSWSSISKVILLPAKWDDLEAPLAADGLLLPEPRLNVEVVAGFQKAGIAVQKVSPQSVRERFRQVKPIEYPGVPVAQAPRECLRQRPWLETLLRFCLSDRPKDLTDLPLALMADGRLRSFVADPIHPIFAAGAEERWLFARQPAWFLDQSYAEACGLTVPVIPTGAYWMTPREVTRCLPALLPEHQEVRLHQDGPKAPFPTVGWLTALYCYLLKAVRGGYVWSKDECRKIPLVPDQTALLHCPGNTGTPLLGREQEMEDLGKVLHALNVPLVTAPPELRDAIATFAGAFPDFVWKLAGPDLVDTLASLDRDIFPTYRQDVHPPLLGYLTQSQWTAEMYRTRPERLSELRRLVIFPTADGQVVDLQGDVFIPGDFVPPSCVRSVTLLLTGPANAWLRLLELAEVSRLTRAGFIKSYLLPEYEGMEADDKLVTMRWLRDNLGRAQSELEEDCEDSDDLLQAVREAPLVRCEDGEYRCAPHVYDPDSDLIKDLFGDSVPYPDRTYYGRGWERWSDFFRGLRLVQTPHAQDLLAHVDRLCEEAEGGLSGRLTSRIFKVFEHIETHWTELCREAVEDQYGDDFAAALRERAWLTAETSGRGLLRWPGGVAPEARLYRSDELYLPAQANLVASQCPVFPRTRVKAEVQKALGFRSNVPLETALLHFEHLLQLWDSANRPRSEQFEAALEDVYRYLASYAKRPEAAVIRTRFAEVACLWFRGQLWLPKHAFRSKVPFFGHRRVSVRVKEIAVRAAYQLLGMREQPSLADFLSYLEELVDAYGGAPLPEDEIEQLLEVYRRIGEEVQGTDPLEERFPLLTQSGTLVDPQDAFYADAPWYQERIKHPGVQFLHRGLPVTVTQLQWVRSLAREVAERPMGDWASVANPEVQQRASKLETLIRSREFRCGVTRLVYHEHGIYRSSDADWLARTRLVAVQELTSELVLTLDEEEVVVGSGPANQYLDAGRLRIFVDGNAGKLIRSFLAEAVNTGLSEFRLQNLSPLRDILDCEPAEIDQTLTRLRIKPVDDDNAFVRPEADAVQDADLADADEAIGDGIDGDDRGDAPAKEEAIPGDHTLPAEGDGSDAGVLEEASPTTASTPGQQTAHPPKLEVRDKESPTEGLTRTGTNVEGERSTRDARAGGHPVTPNRSPTPATDDTGGDRPHPDRPAASDRLPGLRGTARPESGQSSDLPLPLVRDSTEQPWPSEAGPSSGQPRSAREVRIRQRRGRGRRERRQRGQDRIVTYVSFGPQEETTNAASTLSEAERRERIELGEAAADLVCAFEREHGRKPTKLAHNHPGWDIDSFDVRRVESEVTAGAPSRMIEVKGVRGPWTRQGVALSRRQFAAAQQFGERYWLYVVEFADEPSRARIHPIHNPFARVTQFWFDSGWRQVADLAEAPSATCKLVVGHRITADNVGNGVVERVEERGALRIVHLLLDGGKRVRKPFNPATMRPISE